jgi:hypothetical protein
LNHPQRKKAPKRRRRRAEYGVEVVTALIEVWDIFEQPCGQRMVAVLRDELERLRRLGELRCSDSVSGQLQEISASTIDRLLRREKGVRQLRRNRNPNVQRLIYQKVPVKVAADWDTSEIGNVQVDFVAHCGRSTGGDYIHTISAVDIATNWWEGQAIAVRSAACGKGRAEPDAGSLPLPHPRTASGQRFGAGERSAVGLDTGTANPAVAVAALAGNGKLSVPAAYGSAVKRRRAAPP